MTVMRFGLQRLRRKIRQDFRGATPPSTGARAWASARLSVRSVGDRSPLGGRRMRHLSSQMRQLEATGFVSAGLSQAEVRRPTRLREVSVLGSGIALPVRRIVNLFRDGEISKSGFRSSWSGWCSDSIWPMDDGGRQCARIPCPSRSLFVLRLRWG